MFDTPEPLALPRHPRAVDFDGRSFTREQLEQLAASPSIVRLDFKNCAVRDEDVRAICGLPKLESLWLEGTQVTDAALPAIARLPKLNWLILDRTEITGMGFHAFTGHKTLQTLWLSNTRVTDEAMPLLAAIPRLSIVVLKHTKITRAGLMSLAKHPTLEVSAEGLFSKTDMREFDMVQRQHANRSDRSVQPNPADAEAAASVLQAFFVAMNAWERELARSNLETVEGKDRAQAQVQEIFAKHCTDKARKYGSPHVLSYSEPPAYEELELLDAEWLTPRKVYYYTKERSGFESHHRFLVIKRGDRWLVDHKQVRGDGWERDYL